MKSVLKHLDLFRYLMLFQFINLCYTLKNMGPRSFSATLSSHPPICCKKEKPVISNDIQLD